MLPISYTAVLVAAIANFIIGFLLHGPILGKLWMKLANIVPTGNEKFSDMYGKMFWNFVANLVCAYVIAVVYLFAVTSPVMGGAGAWNGVVCAFWLWLGFIVTSSSMDVIWMGRSSKLWLFECFASLLSFAAMGAIIATW